MIGALEQNLSPAHLPFPPTSFNSNGYAYSNYPEDRVVRHGFRLPPPPGSTSGFWNDVKPVRRRPGQQLPSRMHTS
jgi:hypothetical protein